MSEEFGEEYPEEEPKAKKPKISALNIVAPQITSFQVDPYLAKLVTLIYFAATKGFTKQPNNKITLEEARYDTTFLYYFENKKLGLSGYVGRDKKSQMITYMIVDNSRFKWAILEGFVVPNEEGILDVKDREFVYNNIGVFRAAKTINDFIDFLSGKPDFQMKGEYITCVT